MSCFPEEETVVYNCIWTLCQQHDVQLLLCPIVFGKDTWEMYCAAALRAHRGVYAAVFQV